MKRLSLLFTVCLLSLWGQGSNTIYQQVFFNATALGASPAVRNIGATFHQLTVLTSGGACSTGNSNSWDVHLEGSLDQTNWFVIGSRITTIILNTYTYVSVSGTWPYVRANYAAAGTGTVSNCNLSAWYAGSLSGVSTSSVPSTFRNDNFNVFDTESTTAGSPIAFVNCITNTLTGSSATSPSVYGIAMSNNGANATQIQFWFGTLAGFSGTSQASYNMTLSPGDNIVFNNGSRPTFFVPGVPLYRTFFPVLSGTSPDISFHVNYRCE